MPQQLKPPPLIAPELDVRSTSVAALHLPWLTEFRFLGSLAVIIPHVAEIARLQGIPQSMPNWMLGMGAGGVRLFFVLSGFLITHLLLLELNRTDSINLKKFYARRALRIWPLYYALLLVAFLIPTSALMVSSSAGLAPYAASQYHHLLPKLSLLIFMLPNLAVVFYPAIAGFGQTWSVGLEEQFYLLWPLMLRGFKQRPLVPIAGAIVLKILLLATFVPVMNSMATILPASISKQCIYFWHFVSHQQFEALAVGGLMAYVLYRAPQLVQAVVENRAVKLLVSLAVLAGLMCQWSELYQQMLCELAFGAGLLALVHNRGKLPHALGAPLLYLGSISYGMYMLHPFIIYFSIKAMISVGLNPSSNLFMSILYALTIVATVLVSSASYELFEKKFLVLKRRFTVVPSRLA